MPRRRSALAGALLLACAGCAVPGAGPAPAAPVAAPADRPAAWWSAAGDPLLADLVDEGLAHAHRDGPAAPMPHAWLHRAPDPAALRARADAEADVQGLHALAIGLAYLEARRAEAHVTLREDAVAGLRDNDEIAGFRREAGLVSAVDTGLAGVLVGLNGNAVLAARADRDAAVAALADLIGDTPGPLTARIEQAPVLRVYDPLPAVTVDQALAWRADLAQMRDNTTARRPAPAAADDPAWQAALARARGEIDMAQVALDAARARLAAATATSSAAESTVADARLAYRAGKTAMPALYVAEAAALAAREGLADAGVAVDRALVQLWSAEGRGTGPASPPPAAP